MKYSWFRRWDLARLGLLASLVVGCATGSTTAGSALVHTHFPYAVTYDDQRAKSVMGEEWQLENYRVASTSPEGIAELARKDGYTTQYDFDFDDDDKGDLSESLPFPDLHFLHKKTNAHLDVWTVLLDKRLADKELRVLLGNIVENASGTRSLFLAEGQNAAVGVEKRFATRILDTSEATLGSDKGLVATVERADLDQVELDPKAVSKRSRLFLVRAPFDYFVSKDAPPIAADTTNTTQPEAHRYRVLLVVEYSNTPDDFEAGYPEFLRLLGKIHLLTDDMLFELLAEPISKCRADGTETKVRLSISPTGKVSIGELMNVAEPCVSFLENYRFAGTGEQRTAEHSYDFSKPLKPAWLTTSGYVEQRTAPQPTEPAAQPASAPQPEPALAEPPAPGASAPSETAPPPAAAPPSPAAPMQQAAPVNAP